MVELAFILILLMMLLVGTVTAAIAFGRGNSIQNAAREASRFGATLPDPGTEDWYTAVRDVARAAAAGDLDPAVPNQEICVAFIDASDVALHVIDDGGMFDPTTPISGACPGYVDGRSGNSEARVNVVVQRDTAINAVLFSVDVTIDSPVSARYER